MSWDWKQVWDMMPQLLLGVWYTVLVTLLSSVITLAGGLLLAIVQSVSTKVGRAFVRFWLELFRGVPVLVLLYFGFYALPQAGITLPALPIGIAVLGIVYAAFCSEVYRGALITIPAGLRDACVALNLSSYVTWRRVLVPLMIQRSAPALANYVLALFRTSSFLFALGVPVLLGQAQQVGFQTFRYLEAFTVAGLFYLAINVPFIYLLHRLKVKHVQNHGT